MSDDLIKRDDALAAIDTFRRDFEQSWKVQFSADIKALPAVPTHRYAGESEASVYNRKGFPPIGLQGHAHAPVADSHPAIDPAAIREAALEDALVAARQELVNGAYIYRGSYQEKPSNMLFVAERMVSKAINSLIGEKNE